MSPVDGGDWRAETVAPWAWCEGVLWHEDAGEIYDPIPPAAEIFDAALRTDPDDLDSVLAFVRAWGVLGVTPWKSPSEVPSEWTQIGESVWYVRRALRELKRHFAWAQALQRREWRAQAVPNLIRLSKMPADVGGPDFGEQVGFVDDGDFMTAFREVVAPPHHPKLDTSRFDPRWPNIVREVVLTDLGSGRAPYPDPYVSAFIKGHFWVAHKARRADVRPRDRAAVHWQVFGWAIRDHLRHVSPTVGWTDGRPTALWLVPHLGDLLWVQLWNLVTGGATMRRCLHCHRWFPGRRRGKVYCSRVCTNRASAAASYEARKKERQGGAARTSTRRAGSGGRRRG